MSILAVALLDDHAGHALDALSSVVLVVSLSGHVLEILHVRANEHVPQLHEIAVCWVFHCRPQSEDQLHTQYLYMFTVNFFNGTSIQKAF